MNIFSKIKALFIKPIKTEAEYIADFKKIHRKFTTHKEIDKAAMSATIEGLINNGWTLERTLAFNQEMNDERNNPIKEKKYDTDENSNVLTLH